MYVFHLVDVKELPGSLSGQAFELSESTIQKWVFPEETFLKLEEIIS